MPIDVPAADRVTLSRYLLGQLSPAEEDRVEDHFATDDSYFALYQEVERALVCDYAAGAMPSPEAALFERNYLVTEERREHVTIVQAMLAVRSEQNIFRLPSASLRRIAPALACAALLIAVALFWVHRRASSLLPGTASVQHIQQTASASRPETGASSRQSPPRSSPANLQQTAANKTAQDQTPRSTGKAPSRRVIAAGPKTLTADGEKSTNSRPTESDRGGSRREAQGKDEIAANQPPAIPPFIEPNATTSANAQTGQAEPKEHAQETKSEDAINKQMPPAVLDAKKDANTEIARAAGQDTDTLHSGNQRKLRIAVLDFSYATVMSASQAIFGTQQDIGRGIADLVIDKLANDGTYRVIERRELDKILKEQNFSNSDRADANSAAKIGRALGVDAIIIGDVTQFGRDYKNYGGAGGGYGGNWTHGLGGVGVHKSKAMTAITARIIDVNTGEILASVNGRGESKRSGSNFLAGGGNWGGGGGGALDMGSSNFQQTIIGEAVTGATTQLTSQLSQDAAKLPVRTVQIKGLVVDATGNSIVINVGSRNGVHAGDKLTITHVSRGIKGPATDTPPRSIEEPLGQLHITSVDESSAKGTFTGAGQPKVGDSVKSQ